MSQQGLCGFTPQRTQKPLERGMSDSVEFGTANLTAGKDSSGHDERLGIREIEPGIARGF